MVPGTRGDDENHHRGEHHHGSGGDGEGALPGQGTDAPEKRAPQTTRQEPQEAVGPQPAQVAGEQIPGRHAATAEGQKQWTAHSHAVQAAQKTGQEEGDAGS